MSENVPFSWTEYGDGDAIPADLQWSSWFPSRQGPYWLRYSLNGGTSSKHLQKTYHDPFVEAPVATASAVQGVEAGGAMNLEVEGGSTTLNPLDSEALNRTMTGPWEWVAPPPQWQRFCVRPDGMTFYIAETADQRAARVAISQRKQPAKRRCPAPTEWEEEASRAKRVRTEGRDGAHMLTPEIEAILDFGEEVVGGL